ncbi:hypothetical protein J6590_052120 [Homalodisca vitripennis]|nr:hypothetical protein J6590_052120 [Homalodisca vitripennis]
MKTIYATIGPFTKAFLSPFIENNRPDRRKVCKLEPVECGAQVRPDVLRSVTWRLEDCHPVLESQGKQNKCGDVPDRLGEERASPTRVRPRWDVGVETWACGRLVLRLVMVTLGFLTLNLDLSPGDCSN